MRGAFVVAGAIALAPLPALAQDAAVPAPTLAEAFAAPLAEPSLEEQLAAVREQQLASQQRIAELEQRLAEQQAIAGQVPALAAKNARLVEIGQALIASYERRYGNSQWAPFQLARTRFEQELQDFGDALHTNRAAAVPPEPELESEPEIEPQIDPAQSQ